MPTLPTLFARRSSPTRHRSCPVAALVGVIVGTTMVPAGAGTALPDSLPVTFEGFGLADATTETVDAPLFDNFTSAPTEVGNPIVEWGAIRVDPTAWATDTPWIGRMVGLDDPIDPLDGYDEEESRAILTGLLQRQLEEGLPVEAQARYDEFLEAPSLANTLSYADVVEPATVADPANWENPPEAPIELPDFLNGPLPEAGRQTYPLVPGMDGFDGVPDGYLIVDDDTEIDPRFLPTIASDDGTGGVALVAVRQATAFSAPVGGGRAENVLRLNLPAPLALPDGSTVGGPTYNGSFAGDIFNDANLVVIARDDNGQRSHTTMAFGDGFWTEVPPIGFVEISGPTTVWGLPPVILESADGIGFATFEQDGDLQQEGSVGSSVFPAFGTLLDPGSVPTAGPRQVPESPLVAEFLAAAEARLSDGTDEAATASDGDVVGDPVGDADADAGVEAATVESPVEDTPETDDADDADDGGNLLVVLIAVVGCIAVGGGLWVRRSRTP
jgi:hypothetical protein